ncbi:Uncharacterized protein ALO80_04110 [Pseudomonas caricapapayae]|uniref:DUF1654 domain-containing protein n=1 Tax=Pseudomonas caricapapayae TaxID=46678 RepID=UPI0006D6229D|nr:DUF1654 domain-containing protein [Pseudomonas caricapapayae]KAA8692048.1 DUF1654 domain-containing protein [Pseudomonas caricapapayae]KPW63062.1 Uncharacterized protein ALO80_04110 [Pseudomonas caricapapayae]RMV91432.1 hypothetical protein ALP01_03530 [Pseudomonas caricapapayae]
MAQTKAKLAVRVEMSGVERLGLRVSDMINHPIAQVQRWVGIHRLDTDGDREWEEVMGVLSATDELDVTFEDDGSVTVRWEPIALDDLPVDAVDDPGEAPAPF